MPRIRVAIVDDEAHARARLRQLLEHRADFELVAECVNGQQALECVRQHKPDLVFLDIQMPRLTGLQVCEALAADKEPLPVIVFVTAYDQYALKAFEIHAVDYLLKPFDRDRFEQCLRHVQKQILSRPQNQTDDRLLSLLNELHQRVQAPDRLVFKQNGRVVFIKPETIDWVESDGNYIKVHTAGETHQFRETLADIEAQLPSRHFMRISRSTIVNLNRVKELQPMFYGEYVVILHNGSKLNMSRGFRDKLEGLLGNRD